MIFRLTKLMMISLSDSRNIYLENKSVKRNCGQLSHNSALSYFNKHITFHCARHSFATLQLTMGTDIYTVSTLFRHKNLKTTEIYGHVISIKKIEAASKIPALSFCCQI